MKNIFLFLLLFISSISYTMNDNEENWQDLFLQAGETATDPEKIEAVQVDTHDQPFDIDREFFCDICQKTFKNKDEIDHIAHMENTHKLCTTCNQTFDSGADVRWHYLMHHVTRDMLRPHSMQ